MKKKAAEANADEAAAKAAKAAEAKDAAKNKALKLLKAGNAKLDAGIYLEALELFKKAYEIYPSPVLHFNIAQTYTELGKFIKALRSYERFIKNIENKERRKALIKVAHKKVFSLLGKIANVKVVTNVEDATVSADGSVVGKTPLKMNIRMMPGNHSFTLTKPGYVKEVKDIKVKAGESVTLRVKLLTEEEHAKNLKVVKALEEKRRKLQEGLKREREEAIRKQKLKRKIYFITGVSGLSVGGAAMLLGGIMGIMGEMESKKVEEAEVGSQWVSYKKHYDNAETYRNVMYYTLPIGGALAIAGAVMLGLSYRVKEAPTQKKPGSNKASRAIETSVLPMVGPSSTGLMVHINY